MELSGIRVDITVGNLEFHRAPAWWIESLRGYPLGRAGITLPDPSGDLHRAITVGDAVTLEFGYRSAQTVVWSGTVTQVYPGETRDQLEVRAVDAAQLLTTTRVIQSWENETPEAIVTWAVRQTGLPLGVIEPTGVVIPRFIASNCPVWQLVRQVAQSYCDAFGIEMDGRALWLGRDGVNWADRDEPGDVPVIATGAGLIDHEPATAGTAMSWVETWLLADLSHSRLVHLSDDRREIDETFRAHRVRHEGAPERVRTFIWY